MSIVPTRRTEAPAVPLLPLDRKHTNLLVAVAVGAVRQTAEQDTYLRVFDDDGAVVSEERVSWLAHDLEALGLATPGAWDCRSERPWDTTTVGAERLAWPTIGGTR